jgi:hypothetical protein
VSVIHQKVCLDFETALHNHAESPLISLLGTISVEILELPLSKIYCHEKLHDENFKKIIKKYLRTTYLYYDGTFDYSSKTSELLFMNIGKQSISELQNIRWFGIRSVKSLYNLYNTFAEL